TRRRARRRRTAPPGHRGDGRTVRPARELSVGAHRDAVVEGAVDARLLDGALVAGNPHEVRIAAAPTVRTRSLGRHRDRDDLVRRNRRRRPFRRACRRGDPRHRVVGPLSTQPIEHARRCAKGAMSMTNARHLTTINLLISAMLVFAATSRAEERSPIAVAMAKAYGLDSYGKIEQVRYTFNLEFPEVKIA